METQLMSRRLAAKNLIAAGAAGPAVATLAEGQQPHMQAALKALNNAAAQLQAAADDKAGHRHGANVANMGNRVRST